MAARLKVLEVFEVKDRAVAACDILEGAIDLAMALFVEGSGDVWTITGIKAATSEAAARGRIGVVLTPRRSGQTLRIDDCLVSA